MSAGPPDFLRAAGGGFLSGLPVMLDASTTHIYVTICMVARKLHSFYLDPELSEGLSAIRDRDGVLPSEQVRRAIQMWLEWKGYKPNSRPQRKKSGKAKK